MQNIKMTARKLSLQEIVEESKTALAAQAALMERWERERNQRRTDANTTSKGVAQPR